MDIREAMAALAATIETGTDRPVTTDPRNVANTPCVLVEQPTLTASGTACGAYFWTHRILVIGLPGAWTELGPLSDLLGEVLAVLDDWTSATPIQYYPLTYPASADPVQAYLVIADEYV